MKLLILVGSLLVPVGMFWLQTVWPKSRLLFNVIAIIAALIFGDLAAIAIQQIIHDNTVFMTNIHGVLLNPFFLVAGSYLGVYLIYRLILWTSAER
ncbi:transposase [Fictibacillus phosphorivorans]|uniref:Transposase n=1 Tax=Fictibacillus phosphorivorans TaxID=1221500 RepID=A0A161INI2_9BACL|nr:transposase [Fictibacillus phosphorivorans]ANC76325.1 transposase [Fictibacillus phosphorivorans]MQR97103.1 transposase [Fictibacillus phosphorivorans]